GLTRKTDGSRLVVFDLTLLPSYQSRRLDIAFSFKLLQYSRDCFFLLVEDPCNFVGVGGSAVPDPAGSYHFLYEELESAGSDFFHSLDHVLQILLVIR